MTYPHWPTKVYQWCLLCAVRAVDEEDESKPVLCPACQAELGH